MSRFLVLKKVDPHYGSDLGRIHVNAEGIVAFEEAPNKDLTNITLQGGRQVCVQATVEKVATALANRRPAPKAADHGLFGERSLFEQIFGKVPQ